MLKNSFTLDSLKQQLLDMRFKLVKFIVGKDPVVMNITVTSDIIQYNKLRHNPRTIFHGNIVKHVSSRQSFVLSPNQNANHVGF